MLFLELLVALSLISPENDDTAIVTSGPPCSDELETWDDTDEVEERDAFMRFRRATMSLLARALQFLFAELLATPSPTQPPLALDAPSKANEAAIPSLEIALSEEQADVCLVGFGRSLLLIVPEAGERGGGSLLPGFFKFLRAFTRNDGVGIPASKLRSSKIALSSSFRTGVVA